MAIQVTIGIRVVQPEKSYTFHGDKDTSVPEVVTGAILRVQKMYEDTKIEFTKVEIYEGGKKISFPVGEQESSST